MRIACRVTARGVVWHPPFAWLTFGSVISITCASSIRLVPASAGLVTLSKRRRKARCWYRAVRLITCLCMCKNASLCEGCRTGLQGRAEPAPSTFTNPGTQFWSVIDGERQLPSEAASERELQVGIPRPASRGDESNMGAWGSPVGLMPMSPDSPGLLGDKVHPVNFLKFRMCSTI